MLKSRRSFLQNTFFAAAVIVVSKDNAFALVTPLQTLKQVQLDLFPKDKVEASNAFAYLSLILNHTRISDDYKNFLKNGVKWLNESAQEHYNKLYTQLDDAKRQDILQKISKESWGESWIRTVLTYLMEALLGDPIYGVNKKEIGWKWLDHESGLPRPTRAYL